METINNSGYYAEDFRKGSCYIARAFFLLHKL